MFYPELQALPGNGGLSPAFVRALSLFPPGAFSSLEDATPTQLLIFRALDTLSLYNFLDLVLVNIPLVNSATLLSYPLSEP